MNEPKYLTEENFDGFVSDNDKPIMLYFWATWCGPCKRITPILNKLADKYCDKMCFGAVNVDECPNVIKKYGILTIPTVVFLKSGGITAKEIGLQSQAVYLSHIKHLTEE